MTEDLKAAAERLRSYWNAHPEEQSYTDGEVVQVYLNDLRTVSAAYLSETDPTPVTEEWLRECGWIYVEAGTGIPNYWRWQGVALCKFGDGWRVQIGGAENFWEHFPNQTRGNVRLLCRALGITLQEGSGK